MPDVAPQCIGSTPPPEAPSVTWEDAPAFREVFLLYFPEEAAEAFRQAGARLYDAALEAGLDQVEPDRYVSCHARALAADLRFIALALASTATAREAGHLEAGEHHVASLCQQAAGEVAAIALNIERAIEAEAEAPDPAEEAARLHRLTGSVRRLLEDARSLRPEAADGAVGQLVGHLRDAIDGLEAEPEAES